MFPKRSCCMPCICRLLYIEIIFVEARVFVFKNSNNSCRLENFSVLGMKVHHVFFMSIQKCWDLVINNRN